MHKKGIQAGVLSKTEVPAKALLLHKRSEKALSLKGLNPKKRTSRARSNCWTSPGDSRLPKKTPTSSHNCSRRTLRWLSKFPTTTGRCGLTCR